jgi:hypothetical protein
MLFSVRGWVDHRAILLPEGSSQWYSLVTLSGIEHATFRLVVVRVGNAFNSLLVTALWNVSLECAVLPQIFTVFHIIQGEIRIIGTLNYPINTSTSSLVISCSLQLWRERRTGLWRRNYDGCGGGGGDDDDDDDSSKKYEQRWKTKRRMKGVSRRRRRQDNNIYKIIIWCSVILKTVPLEQLTFS